MDDNLSVQMERAVSIAGIEVFVVVVMVLVLNAPVVQTELLVAVF
jgi:hypothetical protein